MPQNRNVVSRPVLTVGYDTFSPIAIHAASLTRSVVSDVDLSAVASFWYWAVVNWMRGCVLHFYLIRLHGTRPVLRLSEVMMNCLILLSSRRLC